MKMAVFPHVHRQHWHPLYVGEWLMCWRVCLCGIGWIHSFTPRRSPRKQHPHADGVGACPLPFAHLLSHISANIILLIIFRWICRYSEWTSSITLYQMVVSFYHSDKNCTSWRHVWPRSVDFQLSITFVYMIIWRKKKCIAYRSKSFQLINCRSDIAGNANWITTTQSTDGTEWSLAPIIGLGEFSQA